MVADTARQVVTWIAAALGWVALGLLLFGPLVAAAVAARYNWDAIRAHPIPWVLQLMTLAFTLAALYIAAVNPCEAPLPAPQFRCPASLAQIGPVLWALLGLQTCIATLLGWLSPRRTLWIPLQALFVLHGAFITVGAILTVSGQYL